MKRKILALLVLALAISAFLTACKDKECDTHTDSNGDEICDECGDRIVFNPTYLGIESVFKTDFDESSTISGMYSKAERVGQLKDMIINNYHGNLLEYANNSPDPGEIKYALVDSRTGNVVFTLVKEEYDSMITETASVSTVSGSNFITVKRTDTTDFEHTVYTQTLYTEYGHLITSKSSQDSLSKASISISYIGVNETRTGYLYTIEDKIYNITESGATYRMDKLLTSIPSSYTATVNHYYIFNSYSLNVTDLNYVTIASYRIPADCELINGFILNNGNVFLQYTRELPADADEYDIFDEGCKYKLYSIIFNISDQSIKNLKLNFVLVNGQSFIADDLGETFKEGAFENLIEYAPIVDKSADFNNTVFATATNNMSVTGYIGKEIPNQRGYARLIADNRFIVTDHSGRKFLINEQGQLIGEVTNGSYKYDTGLFHLNGKYYDTNLQLVFDEENIEYTRYTTTANYSVYYATRPVETEYGTSYVTNYFIYKNGKMIKIDTPTTLTSINFSSNYFTYTYRNEASKNCTVYCNTNGEKIYTVDHGITNFYDHSVMTYGNLFIITLITRNEYYTYSYQYYIAN